MNMFVYCNLFFCIKPWDHRLWWNGLVKSLQSSIFLYPLFPGVQTARPVLYDASLVNAMIADVERIDISSISSQAFQIGETTSSEDEDDQLNAECKFLFCFVNG